MLSYYGVGGANTTWRALIWSGTKKFVLVMAGVLTISDRCSKGEFEDTSGPNLKLLLSSCQQLQISKDQILTACVSDEKEKIQRILVSWTDELRLSLVLTTGGTGLSPRDVTPEAVHPLLDKEAPGLSVAMITKSLAVTPMAMLSRPVCGVRKSTLIVTLPGSKKGSQECLGFILPTLPHALDLVRGSSRADLTHTAMQGTDQPSLPQHSHTCPHGHTRKGLGSRTKDSFYPVAFRPRKSPYPMLTVEEALKVIMERTPNQSVKEEKHVNDALHCVLAQHVDASMPLPPFPASIKDGYAVLSDDGVGERQVVAPVTAGESPSVAVSSGEVARITTGAPLPPGADAVVQVEDTELVDSSEDGTVEKCVKILADVKPGCDVRPIGSDISLGERVLECGEILSPSKIGLAASVGVDKVCVFKRPTVALLSTGNEVVNVGQGLSQGQIYDSNRPTLEATIKEKRFTCLDLGIAKDTRESLVELLTKALDDADVLVTTGGVSMGEKDLLKPVLETDFGATIHFGRVFMKPGKPTTFATAQHRGKTKLIFALPGNPVSATVTFQLFVLPALKRLAGWNNTKPTLVSAKLGSNFKLDPRPEYHRVHLSWSDEDPLPVAVSTGNQRSSRLLSVRDANALLVLPARSEHQTELRAGSVVRALLLGTGI